MSAASRVSDVTSPRLLFSEDAEQSVLSAMLADERAIPLARAGMSPTDFYREPHRLAFRAMCELHDRGSSVDPVTVAAQLERAGDLERAGGKDYIAQLIWAVPLSENIQSYTAIVRSYAQRRALLTLVQDAATLLADGGDSRELSQQLLAKLLPFSLDEQGTGFRHVRDFVMPLLANIESRASGARGLQTGYAAIDNETNGFRPGELVIVAGAEKLGKSAIALNIARRVLRAETPVGVGYVSAEMTGESLVERLIAADGRIDATALQSGKLVDEDWPRLVRTGSEIRNYPLWIDDEAEPSLADVVARSTNLKAQHPEIGLIIVDFMQLIQSPEKGQTEARELKKVAYGLKGLAKRLGVVVMVPCQINSKEVEDLKDMRPRLKDLQGSSGMRQAADFIALAYREGLYNDMAADADVLELNFAACRRTRRFIARLRWDGPTMSIHG